MEINMSGFFQLFWREGWSVFSFYILWVLICLALIPVLNCDNSIKYEMIGIIQGN